MANEAVLKYLQDTNRPYSCTDVTANLRGAHNKAATQRALDALSESGQIRVKLYGKQKVYVAPQGDDSGAGEDIGDLEEKLQTLSKQLTQSTALLKTSETKLRSLTALPTTSEAERNIQEIRKRIDASRSKLIGLKTSTNVISDTDKKTILAEHGTLLKEYRKRKSICSQMMDAILEGYPKSKKNLIEELCLETDEMVNFAPTLH